MSISKNKISFANDEFIQNISGYIGDYCENLIIKTTKGLVKKFGEDKDPNFSLEIGDDKVITGISFGIGSNLHNITAHYAIKPLTRIFSAPSASIEEYSLTQYGKELFGETNEDSKEFDDFK